MTDKLKYGIPFSSIAYIFLTPLGNVLTRTGYFGVSGFDEVPSDKLELAEAYILTESEKNVFLSYPNGKVYCRETRGDYKRKQLTPVKITITFASHPSLKDAREGKLKSLKGE